MSLSDFKKYFMDVEICKYDGSFKYSGIKCTAKNYQEKYYKFIVKQKGKYYLSYNQRPQWYFQNKEDYKYASVSIILGKILGDGIAYIEGQHDSTREVGTRCIDDLDIGTYVVYVRANPEHDTVINEYAFDKENIEYGISVYGVKEVFIREIDNTKCNTFLKEVLHNKILGNRENWLDHSKYGNKDSKYFIETTSAGFSIFYYNNRSRSLLREEIEFKNQDSMELVGKHNGLNKVRFDLKPNCEELVILKHFNNRSNFKFLCYPTFECATGFIIDYIKSFGEAKSRMDNNNTITEVVNYLGKDDDKFYYLVENNGDITYEEFVSFTMKNCAIEEQDDNAGSLNFVLKKGDSKMIVIKKNLDCKTFSVGYKFKYKLYV